MSDGKDFVIKDGVLEKYIGKGGDVVIPDTVTCIGDGAFYNRESITSIEIPDTVTTIEGWAFFKCKGIKLVVMPDSIKSIGEKAFSQCTSLVWVNLSRSITNIADGTFEDCKSLMSIKIPDDVTRIGTHAFSGCFRLTTVILPERVTIVEPSAFSGCNSLADEKGFAVINDVLYGYYGSGSEVSIPEGITGIDEFVFYYCSKITTLSIPDSIKFIGKSAFKGTNIKKLILPVGISEFENSALEVILNYFWETDHKQLVLDSFMEQAAPSVLKNESVKRKLRANKNKFIDSAINSDDAEKISRVFKLYELIELDDIDKYIEKAESATSVKAFLLDYKNKNYSYETQVKYENDKLEKELGLKKRTVTEWRKIFNFEVVDRKVTITGYKGKDTNVIIPAYIGKYEVVAIGDFAFSPEAFRVKKEIKETRRSLKSVLVPETVIGFGKGAFYRCEGLADESGLVIVGSVLFSYYGKGDVVKLPDGVTAIDENAFCKGKRIVKIEIPDSVTSIGDGAFSKCKRLIIYASEGSYAEKYAEQNGIKIVKK